MCRHRSRERLRGNSKERVGWLAQWHEDQLTLREIQYLFLAGNRETHIGRTCLDTPVPFPRPFVSSSHGLKALPLVLSARGPSAE